MRVSGTLVRPDFIIESTFGVGNRSTLAGPSGQPNISRPANLRNPRLPDRRRGRDFTHRNANVSRTKKSHFCPGAQTAGRFLPVTH